MISKPAQAPLLIMFLEMMKALAVGWSEKMVISSFKKGDAKKVAFMYSSLVFCHLETILWSYKQAHYLYPIKMEQISFHLPILIQFIAKVQLIPTMVYSFKQKSHQLGVVLLKEFNFHLFIMVLENIQLLILSKFYSLMIFMHFLNRC